VSALRAEIDDVRRGLGIYRMSYVRSILTPDTEPLWARLGQALETRGASSQKSMWSTLGDKMEERGKEGASEEE
jgi:hypothetical protein